MAWGDITGTLSNQGDLQTELNAKATLTHGSGQHDASVASIGAGSHVQTSQLGSGTADGTTFLRGDQTWAVPAGGTNPFTTKFSTINTGNASNATWATVNYINFTLAANSRYIMEGFVSFRTAVTSTGIAFAWSYSSASTTVLGQGIIQNAAQTANMYMSMDVPSSTSGSSTGVLNPNLDNPAYVWCVASTSGGTTTFLAPLFRSEVNNSYATVTNKTYWRLMSVT